MIHVLGQHTENNFSMKRKCFESTGGTHSNLCVYNFFLPFCYVVLSFSLTVLVFPQFSKSFFLTWRKASSELLNMYVQQILEYFSSACLFVELRRCCISHIYSAN